MTPTQLGRKIRTLRERRKLTQVELAQKAQLGQAARGPRPHRAHGLREGCVFPVRRARAARTARGREPAGLHSRAEGEAEGLGAGAQADGVAASARRAAPFIDEQVALGAWTG